MAWMITGGAGFIGSAFVRKALEENWTQEVVVLDALTYAGNLENLSSVEEHPGFQFIHGNICNKDAVTKALTAKKIDAIFHFAAESHVDRSIQNSQIFVETNVLGTQVLLDAARAFSIKRFVHISTDEVYGSLELDTGEKFTEDTPLNPTSPYAASKAASDLLVLAAHKTYGLDTIITRCSNNYGAYQYPEKFIPLFITGALQNKELPLYGTGLNVRDWIHVDTHVEGIYKAYTKGRSGEVYNLGGECERSNIAIAKAICKEVGISEEKITPVTDRLSHDLRYAIDATKAKKELGFNPGPKLDDSLKELVTWYQEQKSWLNLSSNEKHS
jgi:dTDP-glucose 4,6-dehydratase